MFPNIIYDMAGMGQTKDLGDDWIYYCQLNNALSQFLFCSRDKNMRQRTKRHHFFYKYVTSPRLLSFSE